MALRFPRRYNAKGELLVEGKETVVNPAYRFGAQQADNLRAAGDLKRSATNEAAAAHTPSYRGDH